MTGRVLILWSLLHEDDINLLVSLWSTFGRNMTCYSASWNPLLGAWFISTTKLKKCCRNQYCLYATKCFPIRKASIHKDFTTWFPKCARGCESPDDLRKH